MRPRLRSHRQSRNRRLRLPSSRRTRRRLNRPDDSYRRPFVCASKNRAESLSLPVRSRRRSVLRCRNRASCSRPRRSSRVRQQSRQRPPRSPEPARLDLAPPDRCASRTHRRVRPRRACSVVHVRCPRNRYVRSSRSRRARACQVRRVSVRRSGSSVRRSDSSGPWVSRGPCRPDASVPRRRAPSRRLRRRRRSPARSRWPKA